jgi:hypothetical protein
LNFSKTSAVTSLVAPLMMIKTLWVFSSINTLYAKDLSPFLRFTSSTDMISTLSPCRVSQPLLLY